MISFTIPARVFRQMLTGCLVAAGKDTNLDQINAVNVEVAKDQVFMASTDRYRMAVAETRAFRPGAEDGMVLMNRPDAERIVKMIPTRPQQDDTVRLKMLADGMYGVSMGAPMGTPEWAVKLPAVDGTFPKWRTLIPKEPVDVQGIKFNPAYLADLNKVPHDRKMPIQLTFHGEFRAASANWVYDEIEWTYLLMPVRR